MLDDSLVITKHFDAATMCDVFTFKFRMVGAKPGEEFVGITYSLDDYSAYKMSNEELIHKMTVNVGAQLAAKYPLPDIALNFMVKAMREKIFEILANEYKANPKKSYNTGGYLGGHINEYGEYDYLDYINLKPKKVSTFAKLINSLPGVDNTIPVSLVPCDSGPKFKKGSCFNGYVNITVKEAIIHLNDWHETPRGKVADWLQNLHDQGIVDLAFKVEVD